MTRTEFRALMVATIGSAILVLGGLAAGRDFFVAYLIGYLFWLGIALGSLALILLQGLTGGRWGEAIRLPLVAAASTIPLLAILFVPLAVGAHTLYPWAHAPVAMSHAKSVWLSIPFFLLRAALCFAAWIALAQWFLRRPHAAQRWAGGGLILWSITMTFASWDWIMSLQPQWWSTVFGMIVLTGQGLSALALVTVAGIAIGAADRRALIDLGNLLLACVIFWAYVSFSQFLVIWSGEGKKEIAWYLPRLMTSWKWLAVAIVAAYFFAPFFLLLFRFVKGSGALLGAVAVLLLVMRFADLLWMVGPAVDPQRLRITWLEAIAPFAIGGWWFFAFSRALRRGGSAAVEAIHA